MGEIRLPAMTGTPPGNFNHLNIMRSLLMILVGAAVFVSHAGANEKGEVSQPGQFTFAWPLGDGPAKPRGATTRGVPVQPYAVPSAEWKSLRAAEKLSAFERDRRAILAMAGPYRVSFDFLEVLRFDPAAKPDVPYQSWGTEFVFVAEDRGDFIALQHILVMRVLQTDGKSSEPIVMRHWRQEWRHEPERMLAYEGGNTWALQALAPDRRRGAWTQTVLQVDDSARYAAAGRWQHADGSSTWISDETRRPLPRREFSVRKDYDVLEGTNRHTIVPNGWVQEENNLKLALDGNRKPRAELPYLAREYGVARYERIRDYDFAPGRRYFERTEPFWAEVRAAWARVVEKQGRYTLKSQVDQGSLFMPFFEYAARLDDGAAFDREEARAFIERILRERYLANG
jgi:hypothetical protein